MDIELSEDIAPEYLEDVWNILTNSEFLRLSQYVHHHWTNRFMHSLNVSYLSWLIAGKLGCDARAAARAGLLHDFCPYDFKAVTPTGESQAYYHPKAAAKNSEALFGISDREREAILSHMFPLGPVPTSREAWLLTFTDKVCASVEFFHVDIALAREGRITILPA